MIFCSGFGVGGTFRRFETLATAENYPYMKHLINGKRKKDSKGGDSSASESKVKREVNISEGPERNRPSVFISYTWESLAHESWVLNLATRPRTRVRS